MFEKKALTEAVGTLDTLASIENEALPLKDSIAALAEGEPDADAKVREGNEVRDAKLGENIGDEVPTEAVTEALKKLLPLLQGDVMGDRVRPMLLVGATCEAVGLAVLLVLWDGDKDAGNGDAVPVSSALRVPVALLPPLPDAVSEKERDGEKETADERLAQGDKE